MKKSSKIIALLLSVMMLFASFLMVGCGPKNPNNTGGQTDQTVPGDNETKPGDNETKPGDNETKPDGGEEQEPSGPELPLWLEQTEGAVAAASSITVAPKNIVPIYSRPSYVANDDSTEITYQATTLSLQINKDATQEFKAGKAYIDLMISCSELPEYDEVSDVVNGYTTSLRFYYYEKYDALYFLYFNDNNGMMSWFTSDSDPIYKQFAADFASGRKVYLNYQFKDRFELIEEEYVFKELEFSLYAGVENEAGEVLWLKAGNLYFPGQGVKIYDGTECVDDGDKYPELTYKAGHTLVTGHYRNGGYKDRTAYAFIGTDGGDDPTFNLTISDLSFDTKTVADLATVETYPVLDKGPKLPSWVQQTEGAVAVAESIDVSANTLTKIHTQPSYIANADKTELTYQAVTMALKLDKDARDELKAGAFIDLTFASVEGPATAESKKMKLHFYSYNGSDTYYFMIKNQDDHMLNFSTTDTFPVYMQFATDFASGKEVYINYQIKDVFTLVGEQLTFSHSEFTLYFGTKNTAENKVVWFKTNTFYWPGEGCEILEKGELKAEYNQNDINSNSGHTLKIGDMTKEGFADRDVYAFIGSTGSAPLFKLNVSSISFSEKGVVDFATAEAYPVV